jgi:hypothetical protein
MVTEPNSSFAGGDLGGAGLSGLAAGLTAASVMFFPGSACCAATRSEDRFNAEAFLILLAALPFWPAAWLTVVFEATGLIPFFAAALDFGLTGTGFATAVLTTFLGCLACSAATLHDANTNVRQTINVRMLSALLTRLPSPE